jgi:long-chain acyl-CoA synthetase
MTRDIALAGGWMPDMPISHPAAIPDDRAARAPHDPCIADERTALDNAAFAREVRDAAGLLAQRGLRRGDVLGVMLPNRVELVITMFAAWRLGAAMTPINPALTPVEVQHQVRDSGARMVIAESAEAVTGSDALVLTLDDVARTHAGGSDPPVTPASLDDLALLIYTSGTTGRPKGVMLDHANIARTAEIIIDAAGLTAGDHCMLVLPLFHVNGIMVSVVSPLAAGGSTTIAPRFDPATFWVHVAQARATYFSAVPTIYAMLVHLPAGVATPASLRFVICGAAPMSAELIKEFEARYGVPLIEGYGLSECTVVCTLNPLHGNRKPGTVGLPLRGMEVRIAGDDGSLHTGSPPGEVVVRGPNVMRGYLGKPEESERAVRDGWLYTGDVGRFDEDGYLMLVDRVKDMIIRGGENIYPMEIETVLQSHPAVLEAAVVGRPHPVYGEEPVAFIALKPGQSATAEELIDYCATSLAKYKRPRAVFIEPSLPKNALGKIAKPALRAMVNARVESAP